MKPDCLAIVDATNDTLWIRSATCSVTEAAESLKALRNESPGETLALIKSYVNESGDEVHVDVLTPWADAYLAAKEKGLNTPVAAFIEVWHEKEPTFGIHGTSNELFSDNFVYCAEVMVPFQPSGNDFALSTAYAATQNLEESWRPGSSCRSTSVGDVLVLKSGDFQKSYVVANIGFNEVAFISRASVPQEA